MKKKVSIIVCAIGAMLIAAACQSKPDTSQYPELILGEWVLTYEKQIHMGYVASENEGIGRVYEFRPDGTFSYVGTNGFSGAGTWSVEKDAITIELGPLLYKGRITKLTNKKLELIMEITASEIPDHIDISQEYERK